MATAYTDTAMQAYALQARTNSAGAAVDDVTGEDLRIVLELFSEGIVGADSYRVRQRQAGVNMTVDVGSGSPDVDKAILDGRDAGQGNYMTRLEAALVNVTVPAAHGSLARLDQVFLVVQDNAYDASSRVLPRLAYRDGTAASSPVVPGPDAAWDAYLLLAEISVPAADTTISDAQITDRRVLATSVLPVGNVGNGVEFGGAVGSGLGGLTSTFDTAATVTFTKPAAWTTYKIIAWASVMFSCNSAGGGEARLLIDGNAGTTATVGMAPGDRHTVGLRHERTGLTANAVVVAQQRETSGDLNGAAGLNVQTVNYLAVRTS